MKTLFFFIVVTFCFIVSLMMIIISYIFGPKKKSSVKLENFECGMPQATSHPKRINTNFYIIAILFLVFDIELIYLYPWMWGFNNLNQAGFYGGIFFITILFIITLYIIERKILKLE